MNIVRAGERFHMDNGWLSAYWLFSFDQYYDPRNMAFGPLRVFNHDTIQAGAGFPTHPHREMEIITYILKGAVQHKDSTGGLGLIRAGEVQRMTAGTGVAHSEFNASKTEPLTLLQMWVLPEQSGLKPSYEQKQFSQEQRTGRLLPIASGLDTPALAEGPVKIHQDTTFFVSHLESGDVVSHEVKTGRRGFLYVIDGEIEIGGETLKAGDQARITDAETLRIKGSIESEIILIDLP